MAPPDFIPAISDAMRETIGARLTEIARQEDVRILFAVESGSRAWGFPSPDSDYDVRFVYVRPLDWYLSIAPGRDVIERPIDDELDISGWDVRKALALLLKPNPVALEWLSSPIRYLWDETVCESLIAFSRRTAHASACLHHYLHLGESQRRRTLSDPDQVSLKKYFYTLRPALALRWIRLHPDTPPPMNLQALVAGLDLDAPVIDEIARLLALKAETREIGAGPRRPLLDAVIEEDLAWAREAKPRKTRKTLRAEADALFREIVRRD